MSKRFFNVNISHTAFSYSPPFHIFHTSFQRHMRKHQVTRFHWPSRFPGYNEFHWPFHPLFPPLPTVRHRRGKYRPELVPAAALGCPAHPRHLFAPPPRLCSPLWLPPASSRPREVSAAHSSMSLPRRPFRCRRGRFSTPLKGLPRQRPAAVVRNESQFEIE